MLRKTLLLGFGVAVVVADLGAGLAVAQQTGVMSDQDYDAAMKQARTSFNDLKKHLDAQAADEAVAEATKLNEIFKKAESFWGAQKNVQDAIDFSKSAIAASANAEKAAKTKDFAGALEAHKALQATCQGCHTTHREKAEDGSYRIKKPVS